MKPRKPFTYFVFLIPLLFLIPVIQWFGQKPLILFPWKQRVYKIDAYSDTGNVSKDSFSTIDSFEADVESIQLTYTLRDGVTYPYAGFYFSTIVNDELCNLEKYDFMKLKISVTRRDVYQIKIKTYVPGHTISSDSNTECPLEKTLIPEEFPKEYRIPLDDFEFLDWWFERQELKSSDFNIKNLMSGVIKINIQETKKLQPDTEEKGSIVLETLSFHRAFGLRNILSLTGFVFSLSLIIIVIIREQVNKQNNQDSPELEYNPVGLTSYVDEDTKRLVCYIMEHYTDPGLSVQMLYNETGISRRRIYSLIKKKYNLAFKPLLTKIRLTEASRLLKETDRSITDIAMTLGFSGSSYFFQVFKSTYSMSPSEYRKHYKDSV